jgi:hypothetical protein
MFSPPEMPESITGALDQPSERKDQSRTAKKVIQENAGNHHSKITRIKPKEFCPRIFWPPMLANLFYEASAQ